jgi:broad specificity phosphatase PhoE
VSATWPAQLWLVRHGESAGNVARDLAEQSGAVSIEISGRDVDVPLSALGERQSKAVGAWFAHLPPSERPTVVLTSPYARARQTSQLIVQAAKLSANAIQVADERLREKEFGSLNRLTRAGIAARFPHEAELRATLGKFYYRAPGGESWCDVILRLRSVLDHIQLRHAGERVLVVTHQVVILCFRYLLENLDEERLLEIDRAGDVANCAITSFRASTSNGRESLALAAYNFVAPLEDAGETITKEKDEARRE